MSFITVSKERREGFGFRRFNYRRLLGLSDEEFAERYLGEMTRYFYEHGREMLQREVDMIKMGIKEGLEIFGCFDCHLPIESPRDLRRYYGNSLHHDCFVKRLEKDKSPGGHRRDTTFRYWERVAKLGL